MIEREMAGGVAVKAAGRPWAWPRPNVWQALSTRLAAARTSFLSLAAGVILWEVIGRVWAISFLPPFSSVVRSVAQLTLSGQIIGDLTRSLGSLAVGYGLAVVFGVTAGLLMGRYRKVEYALDPVLTILLASPKILFIPVLYSIFGVSRGAQVAVIFLSAVFIIVVNTMSAVRTVDPAAVEMARVFGASRYQMFRKVLLPGSLPLTMAGLRLGIGRAVKGMITGEMFITLFGLGALLRKFGNRFDAASVFAILMVVVIVALACTQAVRLVERRLTHWAGPAD